MFYEKDNKLEIIKINDKGEHEFIRDDKMELQDISDYKEVNEEIDERGQKISEELDVIIE